MQLYARIKLHSVQYFFRVYRMGFVEALKPWSAVKIAETLGCPERTVYAWKMAERLPPEWLQRLIIDRMKRVKPSN